MITHKDFVDIKKPIVFLPGTLCDARLWMPVWRHLICHERQYVPLQWAETLEQMLGLLEHTVADRQVQLVGFSMGGYIASLFALKYPHLADSLTLVGHHSQGLSNKEASLRGKLISALNKGQFRPMSKERLADFVHKKQLENPAVAGTIRDMEQDLGGSVLLYQTQATTPRQSLTDALQNAPFDLHLVAGSEDQIVSLPVVQQMHQAIPRSQLHIITDAGHMLPLEQPLQLATTLGDILQ